MAWNFLEAPLDYGIGRGTALSRNLTWHFSGVPGGSTGAELCRLQEAQDRDLSLWLDICLLWPCVQRSSTSQPSKCVWIWPCAHAGLGLSQYSDSLGFYLTRREKTRYLLLPSHVPHPTAQLALAPFRTKVNQGPPCRGKNCRSSC